MAVVVVLAPIVVFIAGTDENRVGDGHGHGRGFVLWLWQMFRVAVVIGAAAPLTTTTVSAIVVVVIVVATRGCGGRRFSRHTGGVHVCTGIRVAARPRGCGGWGWRDDGTMMIRHIELTGIDLNSLIDRWNYGC